MAFRFFKNFLPHMEKKSSVVKYVIYVAVIRWVHIELVLLIFPWCICLVKFFLNKLPPGVFLSRKIVSVLPRGLLGAPVYIATIYVSGTKEPSLCLGPMSVKVLEFKVPRLAYNGLCNLA